MLTLALLGSLLGAASARPVAIGGVPTSPVIETKPLSGEREGLPVWFLPRLGLQTRNNPQDLWLSYGTRSLRYTPQAGWSASGFKAAPLPPPERYGEGGSLHVSLDVLRALGVPLAGDERQLDVSVVRAGIETPAAPLPQVALVGAVPASPVVSNVKSAPPRAALPGTPAQAAPPALHSASVVPTPLKSAPGTLSKPVPTPPGPAPSTPVVPATPSPPASPAPLPAPGGPSITGVRSSLSTVRNVQVQRLVIDLSGPVSYSARNERGGVTVFLPQVSAVPSVQTLESGDTLTLALEERGVTVRLDAGGGLSQVMTLDDPDRLVIDTATSLSADVPPPVKEDALPDGVSLRVFGGLSLLSFDPARYAPHVVAAPSGSALSVAELVARGGGVAGVNGGYFDPPSSLPVDFVAVGGRLLSASLERRGTVGFDAQGAALFGFPRPRYMLSGAFGSLTVNTVTSRAMPKLLSAFVGDGRTAVGGAGLLTLTLNAQATAVVRADMNGSVPAAGLISVTFDPSRFPQLPRTVGAPLQASLNYQVPEWQQVREGLSAGPMLLQGGEIVLNPEREAFNVLTGVWRPTRQVAFAIYKGQPTLAFLEFGTPETFARALHNVGVQDALRLDSGSSATVFVSGGYLGTGGYLNSVWSRPVPNAIVLVPLDSAKALGAGSKNLR
ncbi:hypothetical protein DKM44_02910 [Deinococcus irradiatisoli]|uniref:Phosphodiester glycosidase domain-containing protein n=1 Tax=Deinococcus irradiatisoli TaxID=2202254 RepID=A0A2Z3JHE9_9DEIO|nr:hypothetical protein DKM44_02910 [Deinococcus irradiatisoli]